MKLWTDPFSDMLLQYFRWYVPLITAGWLFWAVVAGMVNPPSDHYVIQGQGSGNTYWGMKLLLLLMKKNQRFPHIPHSYMEMGDAHVYPSVPQTEETTNFIRNLGQNSKPVFLSEYGIGSAVDLWRVTRHFERFGKEEAEDAKFYKDKLDKYLIDWEKWKLDQIYARPEDFFTESLRRMASQRTLGLTAIRSNPKIIGYNLTGMNDHVMTGEGLTTTFRELKPGTVDAMFEGLAPLRWCLFAEPKNMYRGGKVKIEVVLANEDVLPPGDYPALIQVVGPDNKQIYKHKTTITIPATQNGVEPPLAMSCLFRRVVC